MNANPFWPPEPTEQEKAAAAEKLAAAEREKLDAINLEDLRKLMADQRAIFLSDEDMAKARETEREKDSRSASPRAQADARINDVGMAGAASSTDDERTQSKVAPASAPLSPEDRQAVTPVQTGIRTGEPSDERGPQDRGTQDTDKSSYSFAVATPKQVLQNEKAIAEADGAVAKDLNHDDKNAGLSEGQKAALMVAVNSALGSGEMGDRTAAKALEKALYSGANDYEIIKLAEELEKARREQDTLAQKEAQERAEREAAEARRAVAGLFGAAIALSAVAAVASDQPDSAKGQSTTALLAANDERLQENKPDQPQRDHTLRDVAIMAALLSGGKDVSADPFKLSSPETPPQPLQRLENLLSLG